MADGGRFVSVVSLQRVQSGVFGCCCDAHRLCDECKSLYLLWCIVGCVV